MRFFSISLIAGHKKMKSVRCCWQRKWLFALSGRKSLIWYMIITSIVMMICGTALLLKLNLTVNH